MKKNFPILMLGLLPMLPTQALHAHSVSNKNTVATVNEAIILQMETNPSAAVKFSAAEELTTPSFLATASAEYATDSFKKKKIIIIKTEEDAKEYTDDDLEKAARKLEKFGNGKVKIERNPETEERIKEETKATIRCIALDRKEEAGVCMVTGKPSVGRVIFAKAY
jgi:hypothetical protein